MQTWNFPLNGASQRIYALSHYKNGNSNWSDFFTDYKQLQLFPKQLMKVEERNNLKLLMNKVFVLASAFRDESFGRLLFIFSTEEAYPKIKSLLMYLSRMPENIPELDLSNIHEHDSLYVTLLSMELDI